MHKNGFQPRKQVRASSLLAAEEGAAAPSSAPPTFRPSPEAAAWRSTPTARRRRRPSRPPLPWKRSTAPDCASPSPRYVMPSETQGVNSIDIFHPWLFLVVFFYSLELELWAVQRFLEVATIERSFGTHFRPFLGPILSILTYLIVPLVSSMTWHLPVRIRLFDVCVSKPQVQSALNAAPMQWILKIL